MFVVAHGDKDLVVKVSHSRKMAKALKKAKKPYKYIEFEQGDHHLSQYEHRRQLFEEMEAFLDKHLHN